MTRITPEEAERLCIAIMQWRNNDGELTNWGTPIIDEIMRGATEEGRIVFLISPWNGEIQ